MRISLSLQAALVLVFAGTSYSRLSAQASSPSLFGVRSGTTGCCWYFERLAPSNVLPEQSWAFVGAGVGTLGLDWSGERLLAYSMATNPDTVVAFHPSDGIAVVLGSVGINNSFLGRAVERDPTTNVIYVALPTQIYRMNASTGALAFHANLVGFKATWDRMYAMGIRADGSAFVLGGNDGQSRHAYYQLDLANGQLTWIADLSVPNGQGIFRDVAVSNTGEIWASYGSSQLTPNANGVYKIDPNSLSVTMIRQMSEPFWGLAFVPGNVEAVYCAPKASSIGCLPTISSDGFPSPTASSGYWIRAGQVRNQTSGTLAFSLGARSATPFGGGTLCVAPPLRRTGSQPSGGATAPVADCSGSWELDFNAWMAQNTALPAGTTVRAQWLGRDPGFAAPNNWSLSDALEFDLRP